MWNVRNLSFYFLLFSLSLLNTNTMGKGLSTLVKMSKLIIGLALVGLLIYTIILIVQKKDM